MAAPSQPAVRLTGVLLSTLLYECANARADLEGFLTGSVATRITQRMDDNSDTIVDVEETFFVIQGYHLLSTRIYDPLGNLIPSLLQNAFLTIPSENVVGYFRFRRQTTLTPSLRDMALCHSLHKYFGSHRGLCYAVFCARVSKPLQATHNYEYAMWRMNERNDELSEVCWQLEKLPIVLVNMVESSADYHTFVSNLSSDMAYGQPIPISLQYMMSAVQPEQLAEQYEIMYGHAMAALKDAADHLIVSEIQAMHLRHEVETLERELAEQEKRGGKEREEKEGGGGEEEEEEEEEEMEGHGSNRSSAIEAPATLRKRGRQVDLLA